MQYFGNVNSKESQDADSNKNSSDSEYKAGQTPIETPTNIENMGLAVFKGGTLVGELNGIETISHHIIIGDLKGCNITIPNPFENNTTIDLSLKLKNKTKNTVKIVNGSPYIKSKVNIIARIASISKDSNYLNKDNIEKIEEYANSYLENNILDYLYKTSKEYNADIDGFGKYCVGNFSTWDNWINYNWLNNYKNSFFNVTVDTNVASSYLLTKT